MSTITELEKENKYLDFVALDYEKYKNESLGKFLNSNLRNRIRSYSTDSGSIVNKVDFAKKAVCYIKSKEDLSEEAKKLSEKIYEFIRKQNL